ncbi:uncharacterized protein LOC117807813 [Notolabrus celidotus]|uniref:uncharacterized protein LOC117807813 n=1 Tax=Notolabrus celidotus TaxID=1203425 RepID=UPI0014903C40|nr:uncharacterized protein LOC117807813 [Notolabrus celidotus]
MNLILITAFLLCSLSWVSVSGSESQTVEVQSGEDVTLKCSNMSKYDVVTFWFRLVKRTNISCISTISRSSAKPLFCDGISDGKFSMWSNTSTIFLQIKSVEVFDSGLYFCGFYEDGRPFFSLIHLKIKGSSDAHNDTDREHTKGCDGVAPLASMILGGVTVFLVVVIISLVVRNRKLQTADKEGQNPGQSESVASGDLNYAAVTFRPKARRREPEPNVVYAATRCWRVTTLHTMKSSSFVTLLGLFFRWLSVSGSESQTVEVQSGEDVTLKCSDMNQESLRFWFRLINRTEISCISVLPIKSDTPVYCVGFQDKRFEMSSNNSGVLLKIRGANVSDSGLYFCASYRSPLPTFSVIHLNVKVSFEPRGDLGSKHEKFDRAKLTIVILGAVTAFLVMVIIGLVVKLQTGQKKENPEQRENVVSGDLDYAAVKFQSKPRGREPEPNVVYAATR